MANVRLDGIDIIKSQEAVAGNAAALVIDDVVTKLEPINLSNGEEIPSVKLNSSTIQDGQVLTYSSGKWVNNDITAAGAAVNNDLGIARTGASTDIAIEYNFGNDPNTTFLLNGSNATVSNLQTGDVIAWDQSTGTWVNSATAGGGGGMIGVDVQMSNGDADYIFNSGTTISGVGGVDTSTLTDGSTVFWSATDQEWKMSSLVIEEI